jgi:hypothetical protein
MNRSRPCHAVIRSGAKNPALDFSADQQQGDPARRDDTPLEYSIVGGMVSQAADLKDGALRYACSCLQKLAAVYFLTHCRNLTFPLKLPSALPSTAEPRKFNLYFRKDCQAFGRDYHPHWKPASPQGAERLVDNHFAV